MERSPLRHTLNPHSDVFPQKVVQAQLPDDYANDNASVTRNYSKGNAVFISETEYTSVGTYTSRLIL